MANPANTITLSGRLVNEVKFIDHANNQSATALLKVAVKDNFMSKGADGKSAYQSQFIEAQTFIKSDAQRKLFAGFMQGEQVTVSAHLKSVRFERNGETVYEQQLVIDDIVSLGKPAAARQNAEARPANAF